MTRKEAINVLKNEIQCVLRDSCERSECASCDLVMPIERILSAYDMAIVALQEQEERENPKPLTWDVLVASKGTPVWIEENENQKGYWAIIGETFLGGKQVCMISNEYDEDWGYRGLYLNTWYAYRNKPKEEA